MSLKIIRIRDFAMKYQPRHRSGTSHPPPVWWAGVLTEYMHRAAIFQDTLENHISRNWVLLLPFLHCNLARVSDDTRSHETFLAGSKCTMTDFTP
ncbi:MAG: hypothetical protein C1941_10095 [Prosthecochloris sp.]|nr:hypothetical protein [Prosthecochloris sp.]